MLLWPVLVPVPRWIVSAAAAGWSVKVAMIRVSVKWRFARLPVVLTAVVASAVPWSVDIALSVFVTVRLHVSVIAMITAILGGSVHAIIAVVVALRPVVIASVIIYISVLTAVVASTIALVARVRVGTRLTVVVAIGVAAERHLPVARWHSRVAHLGVIIYRRGRVRQVWLSLLFFLLQFIVQKVVENGGAMVVVVNDREHLLSLLIGHLLGVAAVGYRLVLIILQGYVPKLVVGHILDVDPLHLKLALPLVLRPNAGRGIVVHMTHHLCDATEMTYKGVEAKGEHRGSA